jgi:hypothetical protein
MYRYLLGRWMLLSQARLSTALEDLTGGIVHHSECHIAYYAVEVSSSKSRHLFWFDSLFDTRWKRGRPVKRTPQVETGNLFGA